MDHSISSIRHVAGRDVYGSLVAAAAEAAAAALRRQTVNTLRPTSVRPSVRPMVGCAVVAWRGVRTSRTPSRLRRAACTNHRRHCGRRNSFPSSRPSSSAVLRILDATDDVQFPGGTAAAARSIVTQMTHKSAAAAAAAAAAARHRTSCWNSFSVQVHFISSTRKSLPCDYDLE